MVGAKPRNGEQRNKLASPERLACCVAEAGLEPTTSGL